MELRVRLDPSNPGQFFACCGLIHLLESKGVVTRSRFETNAVSTKRAEFILRTVEIDLSELLDELRMGTVAAAEKSAVEIEATIEPVVLQTRSFAWRFDWWLTEFGDESTDLKCWAGQVKSLALTRELFTMLDSTAPAEYLFDYAVMAKAKFGIDPRSAWNALDLGYSPNEHGKDAATYPMVEVLGCLGLQSFRPTILRGRKVRYGLWLEFLPIGAARLAAFLPWPGLEHQNYEFSIEKRGQSYKFFSFSKLLERQR